ncbi:MAG: integrase [Firmicutes bacterium]|nr:integrase [Bacillota bacterium]
MIITQLITNYEKVKINGLNYVREIKKETRDKGEYEPSGYLIISQDNKPIRNAYYFIKQRVKEGDALNTIKRKCYDLCHLFDFMTVNNIDEELLDNECLLNFIMEYLPRLDSSFKYRDCIEKSMAKEIPVLPQYQSEKVIAIRKNYVNGFSPQTIVKILTTVKEYLIWLAVSRLANINLDEIFTLVNAPARHKKKGDYLLNHLTTSEVLQVYSITGLLKRAKIPYKSDKTTPVEEDVIFQHHERDAFFDALNRKYSPSYQLLFYLLSITGLRVTEGLALKIDFKFDGKEFDFKNSKSDIYISDEKKDKWKIKVVIRADNPPDLSIKNNKPREIMVIDKTKTLQSLLKNALIYRIFKMKKKRISHDFLFINERGERLKYHATKKTFDKILVEANLGERTSLVIHSFRHTFASEWIEINSLESKDVELAELSNYLGHSSPITTQKVYVHFFKDTRERMVSKMDEARHQKRED